MEFSYLFGLLTNLSISIGAWLFLTLAYIGGLFGTVWYGQYVLKRGFFTVMAVFMASLVGTGILGCVFSMVLYLIAYSLLSDFKNDYQ
jgi:hypothetical protein